ncbi:MAG TPA: hypothetical protein VFZ01_10825 [Geminicoccaceae bacterium]
MILNDELELDPAAAEADILAAGRALTRDHPEVGAILLECTNMCPYSAGLQQETGLPVFDMTGLVRWFESGLRPKPF